MIERGCGRWWWRATRKSWRREAGDGMGTKKNGGEEPDFQKKNVLSELIFMEKGFGVPRIVDSSLQKMLLH